MPTALLYNKVPFAELHALLVPDGEACHPQLLDERFHHFAWERSAAFGATLPGVALGYNALGAHASVNHLHFQLTLRERPLPVAAPQWRHNGGAETYPAACQAFDAPDAAWRCIDRLHRSATPYNLIYTPGRLYCLPRRNQARVEPPPWGGTMAWGELAGSVVTFNRTDYERVDADEVVAAMRALAPRPGGH